METMTVSKYAITAGAKPAPKRGYDRAKDILEGVNDLERSVVALRRRQYELEAQMDAQLLWLRDTSNWGSDLWRQRQQIHHDRNTEWKEIIAKVDGLLEILWGQIGTLEEGSYEKQQALIRLISWEEAPF